MLSQWLNDGENNVDNKITEVFVMGHKGSTESASISELEQWYEDL